MNKRGQFYIIAAIIIIMIIFGLVAVKNKATVQPKPLRFYDLSQDYGAETARVIDYGVYNRYSPEVDINKIILNISETFAESAFAKDPNIRLKYIYGNITDVDVEDLAVVGGEVRYCVQNVCTIARTAQAGGIQPTTLYEREGSMIKVNLTGNEYEFNLTSEDNFYFIVQTTTPTGEKIVVTKE